MLGEPGRTLLKCSLVYSRDYSGVTLLVTATLLLGSRATAGLILLQTLVFVVVLLPMIHFGLVVQVPPRHP